MADLIFKIDGLVFELQHEGYTEDEIVAAMLEWLDIFEELQDAL